MTEEKKISVTLKYKSGFPVFEFPTDAKISVDIIDTNNEAEMKEVIIEGNMAGLYSLAKALLAISEIKGYHAHFDNKTDIFYRSDQNFTLTLSNNEKKKYFEKRTTITLPPDW